MSDTDQTELAVPPPTALTAAVTATEAPAQAPPTILVHINHTNGDHESYEATRIGERPNTLLVYCLSGEVIRLPVRNIRDWWTA